MFSPGPQAEQGFYFVGKDLSGLLKEKFQQLLGDHEAHPEEAEVVMGRTLKVFFLVSFGEVCAMHIIESHSFSIWKSSIFLGSTGC